jgi:hypothetical protein
MQTLLFAPARPRTFICFSDYIVLWNLLTDYTGVASPPPVTEEQTPGGDASGQGPAANRHWLGEALLTALRLLQLRLHELDRLSRGCRLLAL